MTDNVLQELSMAIIKAKSVGGKMSFRMVASDTDKDLYNTQMSHELFSDFVRRIENRDDIPEPFQEAVAEENWDGGMPYLSIAHYKSAGGQNVPGAFEKIYVDGDRLKALGYCFDNRKGRAVFKSLCDDLEGRSQYENKIRASIGFLDLKHSHGDFVFERKSLADVCPMCDAGKGEKVFLAGQLVHIALTRAPVNPRTDVSVEERSMDVHSKHEDAESILGDATEELVEQSMVSDVLQVRSDETNEIVEEAVTNAHKSPPKGKPQDKSQYADPKNYKYPIDKKHIAAAVAYFNHSGQQAKGGYSDAQWASIGRKIAAAATRLTGVKHTYSNGKIVTGKENKSMADVVETPVEETVVEQAQPTTEEVDDAELPAEFVADLTKEIEGQEVPDEDDNSPVAIATKSLLETVAKLKSDKSGNALEVMQSSLNQLGEAIQKEFSTPTDPMEQYASQMNSLNDRCTRMESMMTSMQADIAAMRESMNSRSLVAEVPEQNPKTPVTVRRSLNVPSVSQIDLSKFTVDQIGKDRNALLNEQRPAESTSTNGVPSKIQEMANRSVYGDK